jgi:hypothetical protein
VVGIRASGPGRLSVRRPGTKQRVREHHHSRLPRKPQESKRPGPIQYLLAERSLGRCGRSALPNTQAQRTGRPANSRKNRNSRLPQVYAKSIQRPPLLNARAKLPGPPPMTLKPRKPGWRPRSASTDCSTKPPTVALADHRKASRGRLASCIALRHVESASAKGNPLRQQPPCHRS